MKNHTDRKNIDYLPQSPMTATDAPWLTAEATGD